MSIKITVRDGKQYAVLTDLHSWAKNPKILVREDLDRLKKHIIRFGLFKPLIITPEGEVIGGNARLLALQELKKEDAWVSVVEPKNETEKLEYALADNDEVGKYVEEDLADLLMGLDEGIDLKDYKINIGKDIDLEHLLEEIGPSGSEDSQEEAERIERKTILTCPNCGHEFTP